MDLVPAQGLHARPSPGYRSPSVEQLLRADREMFRVAQEKVRGGIKPRSGGVRPLEQAFKESAVDVNVTFMLLPLPVYSAAGSLAAASAARSERPASSSGAAAATGQAEPKAQSRSSRKRQRERDRKAQHDPRHPDHNRQKDQSRGEQGRTPRPAAALAGSMGALPDGTRICWNYNLAGCSNKVEDLPGGCKGSTKGVHVCSKCGKPGHRYSECKA